MSSEEDGGGLVGATPGALSIPAGSPAPSIRLIDYDESQAEELEDLEARIFDDPDPDTVLHLHKLHRCITTLRRVARPQVEALYRLTHTEPPFISHATLPFLSDTYDHAQQIMGRIDAARELQRLDRTPPRPASALSTSPLMSA